MKRSFLFLAGPASPFFALLGEELLERGHRVLRINFNSGDKFFWDGEHTADYKLPLEQFGNYIDTVAKLRKITDLVIYDDSCEVHQAAIEALKNHKIRIHAFDDGYFGENWVTLEERIFGNKTVLPKDPRFYLRAAEEDLPRVKRFVSGKRAKSFYKLQYHLSSLFGKAHGFKESDVNIMPIVSYIRAYLAGMKKAKLKTNYFLADLEMGKKASFLRSFAGNADENNNLVLFDEDFVSAENRAKIMEIAEKYNVAERITIVENANFANVVKGAKAYITNNDMRALTAIAKGKPVMALAEAIYNIAGLTSQCTLNEFWKNIEAPDAEIFRKFRNYVIFKTQINGNFYNRKAMKLAIGNAVKKMIGKVMVAETSEIFDAS